MVQVTVDTKRDSPDDIRKVIEFLQSFINTSNTNPPPGSFSIFDSPPKKEPDDKPPRVEIVDF